MKKDNWDDSAVKTEFRLGEQIIARSFFEMSMGNYYRLAQDDPRFSMGKWVTAYGAPSIVGQAKYAFRVFVNDEFITGIVLIYGREPGAAGEYR